MEGKTWTHLIDFDEFCEYVLPYRLSCEPIEDWKVTYYQAFKPLIDSVLIDRSDPLAVCEILYDTITSDKWIFTEQKLLPYMGALNLLESRVGNCDDRAEFAAYIMKALGLPGGIDCVLQQPKRNPKGHSWNFVLDSMKNVIEFMLYDQPPVQGLRSRDKGKIYRKTFGTHNDISLKGLEKDKSIPAPLDDCLILDVSEYYFPNSFSIPIDFYRPYDMIYLCVFNNQKWVPIASVKNKESIVLRNTQPDIIYLMGYYDGNQILPASYPFRIVNDSCYELIKPCLDSKQDMRLTRKYPIKSWWEWLDSRSMGGKFQVADYIDFRDSITICQIEHGLLDMRWHHFQINPPLEKRYIRYYSAENGYCNLAEMEVFVNGELVTDRIVIGSEGSYRDDSRYEKDVVFDGNPLTFYDAKEASSAWVGLDLGVKSHINEISYLFRNDDNSIRINDKYELFYWDSKWISLGEQIATENELYFEYCPTNALFLLHNHTRGMEERIFLYKDGKQEWW